MTSNDDQLIRRFLVEGSGAAFAALVSRHLPLVYAAALRQLDNDPEAAQDVAQDVFIDLAKKARSVVGRTSIADWLYTATSVRRERGSGADRAKTAQGDSWTRRSVGQLGRGADFEFGVC